MSIISIDPFAEATKARRLADAVPTPSAFGWKVMPAPWAKVLFLPWRRWVKGNSTAAKYDSAPWMPSVLPVLSSAMPKILSAALLIRSETLIAGEAYVYVPGTVPSSRRRRSRPKARLVLPSPNEIHFPSPLEAAKVVSLRPIEVSSRLTPYSTSDSGAAVLRLLIASRMPKVDVTQTEAEVAPDAWSQSVSASFAVVVADAGTTDAASMLAISHEFGSA